jgi:hypothetical protein
VTTIELIAAILIGAIFVASIVVAILRDLNYWQTRRDFDRYD